MKNHIIIKFLAVFLCAVSLLGAIGSGAGILAMTEMGLYQRTLEDVHREQLENYSISVANDIAVRYASMNLGGTPAELADEIYGTYWYYGYFDWDKMGYSLLDAEGNVLQEQPLEEDAEYTFAYPASGRYCKVLSTMTEEEYNALITPQETEPQDGSHTVYNIVPPEGAEVTCIEIEYADGSNGIYDVGGETLGILAYGGGNSMEFHSQIDFGGLTKDPVWNPAVNIRFLNEREGLLYEAWRTEGVVKEYSYTASETFLRLWEYTEDTQHSTVLYDAIPPEGMYVTQVHVTYADGSEESAGGEPDIGFLGYDEEGYVVFTTDAGLMEYKRSPLTYIAFFQGDALVYEASDLDSVGRFTLSQGQLTFRAEKASEPDHSAGERYVYDDIPPQGYAVNRIDLRLKGNTETITVEKKIGTLGDAGHDENGYVVFYADNWKDFTFSKPAEIEFILMLDEEGRVLYESYANKYAENSTIGYFYYDAVERLVFSTAPDAALSLTADITMEPTEVATESTPETVPEATSEIISELNTIPTEPSVTVPQTTQEPTAPNETLEEPAQSASMPVNRDADGEGKRYYNYFDSQAGAWMMAEYTYEEMPPYTVELRLAENAFAHDFEWTLLEIVYALQDYLFPVLVAGLLLFAVTAVYLCCAAGKKPGSQEIRAGGLNRIPLDLYLGGAFLAEMVLFWLGAEGVPYLLDAELRVGLGFAVLLVFAMCLVLVAFCFACAAQFKTPGGFWWKNSLCVRSVDLLGTVFSWMLKGCVWLSQKCDTALVPLLVKFFKGLGKLLMVCWKLLVKGVLWLCGVLDAAVDWIGRTLSRFFSLLPLTWQWLVVGFWLVLWLFLAVLSRSEFWLLIWAFVALATVFYGAHCFGSLLDAARRMRKGGLDEKVDDKLLIGSFKDFAGELNGLADVAVVAAQKQLKSERMKTELITNVSHDIKTPLTSIINYVDLLQKPHSSAEQAQYLEVLDRQSQRLKKLIDDLMEMSKASTGNMAVDIRQVDAGETVNQALGEFADKLEKAQLTPVFRQPDTPVQMMADGRLVWRVLSNLLGNAVKYALPGTRIYLDLTEMDGKVILSMKNISREELNVSADELLERFVRGDASRNTEGSGLGLNIAKSLMELQKGQLQILVDGDLFKVTLIFPGVEK